MTTATKANAATISRQLVKAGFERTTAKAGLIAYRTGFQVSPDSNGAQVYPTFNRDTNLIDAYNHMHKIQSALEEMGYTVKPQEIGTRHSDVMFYVTK